MPLTLPIEMGDRRFEVTDQHVLQEFGHGGEDFEGITLTLELKSTDEAKAVLAAMFDQCPEGNTMDLFSDVPNSDDDA